MCAEGKSVVIAESDNIVRTRIKVLLLTHKHVKYVYESTNATYITWLKNSTIDLAIVNQALFQSELMSFSRKFVIVDSAPSFANLKQVYDTGALGYLSYHSLEAMLAVILRKEENSFLIEPGLAPSLIKCLADARSLSYIKDELLTPREKEIVTLLRSGVNRESIAQQLHIADATLKTHIKNIARKREILLRT